jgi:hypothetical protein
MPEDLGGDRGGLTGKDAGRGSRGRSRHGDADNLVRPQEVCRGDAGPGSAYIQGLRELDELDAGGVDATKKDRYLKTNTRGTAALGRVQALTLSIYLDFQTAPIGTRGLVRLCIFNARK